jgi:hypothetical protein
VAWREGSIPIYARSSGLRFSGSPRISGQCIGPVLFCTYAATGCYRILQKHRNRPLPPFLPLRSVVVSRLTQTCALPHCFFGHRKTLNFPARRGPRQWRRLANPDPARVAGSPLLSSWRTRSAVRWCWARHQIFFGRPVPMAKAGNRRVWLILPAGRPYAVSAKATSSSSRTESCTGHAHRSACCCRWIGSSIVAGPDLNQ